ncbi:hypothetical protein K505DRAFT_361100 [Melanomma pulvis-pyrius CBS 109.77]|uniref:Uncharacterized protein n=1 Tax=Melanomma pulvis-pyrius CBS 109.77 TaxID=1314802 RepID=A0A6A6XEH6_9PLEO|nr:hypothetical protein K505DRAFT_361100 [Melanomma pulvis-pyrius CBS 109.77]
MALAAVQLLANYKHIYARTSTTESESKIMQRRPFFYRKSSDISSPLLDSRYCAFNACYPHGVITRWWIQDLTHSLMFPTHPCSKPIYHSPPAAAATFADDLLADDVLADIDTYPAATPPPAPNPNTPISIPASIEMGTATLDLDLAIAIVANHDATAAPAEPDEVRLLE